MFVKPQLIFFRSLDYGLKEDPLLLRGLEEVVVENFTSKIRNMARGTVKQELTKSKPVQKASLKSKGVASLADLPSDSESVQLDDDFSLSSVPAVKEVLPQHTKKERIPSEAKGASKSGVKKESHRKVRLFSCFQSLMQVHRNQKLLKMQNWMN